MSVKESRGIRRGGGELLTEKEMSFVANFRGDAAEAVRASDFSKARPAEVGCRLLKKPRILKAVLRKQARMIDLMAAAEVRRMRKAAARIPDVENGAAPLATSES